MLKIFQILPPHHWAGCLIYVDEDGIRTWGVMGYWQLPRGVEANVTRIVSTNRAYIRVNTAELKLIGEVEVGDGSH